MRPIACIIVCLLLASAPHPPRTSPHTLKTPAEVTGDSLYDAGAIDSLLAFSSRMIRRAGAQHDSVMLGRMIYFRGRARLALRDARAPEDFERAVAIAAALGDSAGRMQAVGLQAFVAVNEGDFAESVRLNRERIALAHALGRRGSEAWGHLLIGYAHLVRDSLPAAKAEYEEAWRQFGEARRPRDQLSASIGLARVLDRMGRYHDARTSYQRVWLSARELNDRLQESDAINNLGAIEQEHGELSLAAEYFERAYQIKRDLRTFDISQTARNVAAVDQMIGRFAHAESTLVEALSFGNQGMLEAGIAVDLGRLRLAQGRSVTATRAFREVLAQRNRLTAITRTEASTFLARALLDCDSVPAAVTTIDDETRRIAKHEYSSWRSSAFLMSARCHRAAGDIAGARASALTAWQDALARHDSTLMVPSASVLSLCERDAGHEADALDWLEQGRSAFEAARAAGEFQWREARRAELASALLEACDLLREHPRSTEPEIRARSLFDFLQQVQARTLLERVTDPRRFADANLALAEPPTSRALQEKVLRPGECFLLACVTPGRVYTFAITREIFASAVVADPNGSLQRRTRNFERLCSRPPDTRDNDATTTPSRVLGEALLGEVAKTVQSASSVYIAMDGFLAGFPVELLVCPGETEPLGVAHETARVPSAAFLAYLRARPGPAVSDPGVLAVASNTSDLAGARNEVDHLASRYGATRTLAPLRNEFLAALSGYDIVHIASHVHVDGERPWNSGVLIGRSETPAAPAATASDSAPAGPLVLSAAESQQVATQLPDDPFVRASEIANRRTSARLVVLSACESALGRSTMAEGVLGIASSFVSAGSRAVVASLWQVDDRTTAQLMEYFYRELASGRSAAAALRRAQLAVRKDKPAPFFWAGFVVIGDGDLTVALERHNPWPARGLAAALILVVTLSLAVWRGRKPRVRIDP